MLERLRLENVGPAPSLEMALGPRLNLITGDNGLGKSFLLDVAWWALTRRWPQDLNAGLTSGYRAFPTDIRKPATISMRVHSKTKPVDYTSTYAPREQGWIGKAGRPWNPGLVIYALADGGFALWDPARNYWKTKHGEDIQDVVPAYVFSGQDVWNGLTVAIDDRPTQVCNGLLADWASWIRERGADAARMSSVLEVLSTVTRGRDGIQVGAGFARLSVNDARDIPTIRTAYGQDVPIVHAALGARRIVALSYVLSWAWREHLLAAELLGEAPTSRVVLLFDEVEAHLHPRWQRTIVPALLKVVETLTGDVTGSIQVLAATHSPLVLASVEPFFDEARDRLFTLRLDDQEVTLHQQAWAKQGDVVNWLVSESFGLDQGRSIEAERAIEAAEAWMRADLAVLPPELASKNAIHAELRRVLAGHDPFWPRWIVTVGKADDAA